MLSKTEGNGTNDWGGDGLAQKKKNLVCVDTQPRALRGSVFLSPFLLNFFHEAGSEKLLIFRCA